MHSLTLKYICICVVYVNIPCYSIINKTILLILIFIDIFPHTILDMKETTRIQLTKIKGTKSKEDNQIQLYLKFKRNIYDKNKKMLQ